MQAWFYGVMDDEELEEIINHTFARLIPEAVEVIWEEVKDTIDGPLQEVRSMTYTKNCFQAHYLKIILQFFLFSVDRFDYLWKIISYR